MSAELQWPEMRRGYPRISYPRISGQATVEYFLLFAVIALICIVTLTSFDEGWRGTVQQLVGKAAENMSSEDPNAGNIIPLGQHGL